MSQLVSILIPAFNAQRYVAATLQSALGQTWPNTEVIVVDDGSRDRTLEICRTFQGARCKVISQPNQGAVAARNAAYQAAQGQFVQWLDADDLLDPLKIERQMRVALHIGDPRRVLAGPFGTFYYRPHRAAFAPSSLWQDLSPVEYFLMRFRHNEWLQTGCWLVSRELSDAAGPWTDAGSPDDDGEYFARVMTKGTGMTFVEDARAYYRVGDFGSVNNARSQAALTALLRSKIKTVKHLLSLEDTATTRQAGVGFLQLLLPYFYPHRQDLVEEASAFAASLGGTLTPPQLKWKYRPAEWLVGYEKAAKLSKTLPRWRVSANRAVDRLLAVGHTALQAPSSDRQP